MHGKNVMGGYADKISYEERWQVIHYIRALQAAEHKKTYSETENTLNNSAVPGASYNSGDTYKVASLDLPEIFQAHAHIGHDSGHSADGHDDSHDHGHDDHSGHDHDDEGHGGEGHDHQ